MDGTDVIKLPVTEERGPDKKRTRPAKFDPKEEAGKRRKNVESLAVLGETDSSVKLLEELVFGAEDELVERLVEVTFPPDSVQKSVNLKFSNSRALVSVNSFNSDLMILYLVNL